MNRYNYGERREPKKSEAPSIILSSSKKLPPKASKDGLYNVTITGQNPDTGEVRIHYVGYDDIYDEWRNKEDVSVLNCSKY